MRESVCTAIRTIQTELEFFGKTKLFPSGPNIKCMFVWNAASTDENEKVGSDRSGQPSRFYVKSLSKFNIRQNCQCKSYSFFSQTLPTVYLVADSCLLAFFGRLRIRVVPEGGSGGYSPRRGTLTPSRGKIENCSGNCHWWYNTYLLYKLWVLVVNWAKKDNRLFSSYQI